VPPGWDLTTYAETALSRFANDALTYAAAKVAGDSSHKLPVRLMPTVRERLSAGHEARLLAVAVAAWITVARGPAAGAHCVVDEALDRWLAVRGSTTGTARAEVESLLEMPGFVVGDRTTSVRFREDVATVAEQLWTGDVRTVLSAALGERSRS
jgi:fructuronate reductase